MNASEMQRYIQDHFHSLLISSLLPTIHMPPWAIFSIIYQHYGNLIALPNALAPALLRSIEIQKMVLISSLKTHGTFLGCINYAMVTDAQDFPEFDVRNCPSIFSDTVWNSKHNAIHLLLPTIKQLWKEVYQKIKLGVMRKPPFMSHLNIKQGEYYSWLGP